VAGTRIPGIVIVSYLRGGHTREEILADYPSLPADGIDAVIRWANLTFGPDWINPS
jgi:uncharacterized protein (DUF433 family)